MSTTEYYYEATVSGFGEPTELQMARMADVLKGLVTYNAELRDLTFVFRRTFPDPSLADPVVRGRFAVLETLETFLATPCGAMLRQQLKSFRAIRVADLPVERVTVRSA